MHFGVGDCRPEPPTVRVWATLVAQREAKHHRDAVALEQTRQRISVQVKTAAARWKQAQQLVSRTTTLLALQASREPQVLLTESQTVRF